MKGLSISSIVLNVLLNIVLVPFTIINLYYFVNNINVGGAWEMLVLLPWIFQGVIIFLQAYPILSTTAVIIKRKRISRYEFWNFILFLLIIGQIVVFNLLLFI